MFKMKELWLLINLFKSYQKHTKLPVKSLKCKTLFRVYEKFIQLVPDYTFVLEFAVPVLDPEWDQNIGTCITVMFFAPSFFSRFPLLDNLNWSSITRGEFYIMLHKGTSNSWKPNYTYFHAWFQGPQNMYIEYMERSIYLHDNHKNKLWDLGGRISLQTRQMNELLIFVWEKELSI